MALGDLSRLELLRSPSQRGGRPQRYVFDYLTVLKQGGQAPNPLIYDGDSIRVFKAEAPLNTDLITTASSNFAPSTIQVNVVGEVIRPGVVEIRSNAPLSQAILASGGVTRRGSAARIDLIAWTGRAHHDQAVGLQPRCCAEQPQQPSIAPGGCAGGGPQQPHQGHRRHDRCPAAAQPDRECGVDLPDPGAAHRSGQLQLIPALGWAQMPSRSQITPRLA